MDFEVKEKKVEKKPIFVRPLSWIGQHELSVLIAVILIIGGLWLAVELADGVLDGNIQNLDMDLIMSLREGEDADNPIGPPWVEEMMRDFTSLGGTGILVLIVVAVTFYHLIQARYKEMFFLLLAVVGAFILSYVLKGFFDRPRPQFIPEGEYVFTASFPSGHALLSAATYLTLGIIVAELMDRNRLKAFILMFAFLIMIIVGFSRVYLGVHWPSDVLAGWALGMVWAIVIWLIFRTLRAIGNLDDQPPSE